MDIRSAEYQGSFTTEPACPQDNRPEYAFVGRSNVGKSSLINMLTGKKGLAKVSGTPGKTQTLNYFLINNAWYLVDLPGYGYARTAKTQRKSWSKMTISYLSKRSSLECVFVLLDSNIPPQAIDLAFMTKLAEMEIPFVIAYTKTDRVSKKILSDNIKAIQKAMLPRWNELPPQFITSAEKRTGREDILEFIGQVNAQIADAIK